jgi:predicted metal-dependent hydrolase
MTMRFPAIPPYSVRESSKAKRVTLKILPARGLEVVTPRGFPRTKVQEIVTAHQSWIHKVFTKFSEAGIPSEAAPALPASIDLQAIGKIFAVTYTRRNAEAFRLVPSGHSQLDLIGDLTDQSGCQELLRCWLRHSGRLYLVPWITEISARTGLAFSKIQIRSQKSRWGSCSQKGAISLNSNLLFLPEKLVRYIMVHELCHTIHLNHSQAFWGFVASLEPEYKVLDAAMKMAWKYVPQWAS